MSKIEPKLKKSIAPVVEDMDKKIKEIDVDLVAMHQEASAIKIKTENDVVSATNFLGRLKSRITRVEQIRKFFVDPLNKQVKEINTLFKPQTNALDEIMSNVKRMISDYRIEEEKKARAEEERLAKIREQANAKREEKGQAPITAPIKSVERADTMVKTDEAKTTTKKVWKFKVVDIDKVPVEYLKREVSYSEVMGAIRSGKREIAGLEIYEDFDISVSAR